MVFPVMECISQVIHYAFLGFQKVLAQAQQTKADGADIALDEWAVVFKPELPALRSLFTGIVYTFQIVLRHDVVHDVFDNFDFVMLVRTQISREFVVQPVAPLTEQTTDSAPPLCSACLPEVALAGVPAYHWRLAVRTYRVWVSVTSPFAEKVENRSAL